MDAGVDGIMSDYPDRLAATAKTAKRVSLHTTST
jgi:hypothetical protein